MRNFVFLNFLGLNFLGLAFFGLILFFLSSASAEKPTLIWDVTDAPTVLKAIGVAPGKLKVVNLWATWCPPCQAEIPEFIKFSKAYTGQNVSVLFVSGDSPADRNKAETFLRGKGAEGRHFQLSEVNDKALQTFAPKWAGALPATFLYDEKGQLLRFWVGRTTYKDLETQVKSALDPKSPKL